MACYINVKCSNCKCADKRKRNYCNSWQYNRLSDDWCSWFEQDTILNNIILSICWSDVDKKALTREDRENWLFPERV